MDLQTDNTAKASDELARLLWVLRNGRGFGLYFVCCNSPLYRQELVDRIKVEYAQPVLEFDLTGHDFEEYIDHRLLTWAADKPAGAPVFLYGLETLLPTRDEDRQFRTLQEINWRRNVYDKLGRNLVIWLPEYALVLLARQAADFYDWHSAVFEFSLPEAEKAEWVEKSLSEFSDGETHAADRMTLVEKQRWLGVLNGLLDETHNHSAEHVRLLNDLGRLHHALGQYEEALRDYQKSLDLICTIDNKEMDGIILNNIARTFYSKGDDTKALNYLQDALTINRETGNRVGEGATLNSIARIYCSQGNYDKALCYIEDSLMITRETGDQSEEGLALSTMSKIYYSNHDYGKALSHFKDALAIAKNIGHKVREGRTLSNISQIYVAQGNNDKALNYLELALKIQREIGDLFGLCHTLCNMGRIHANKGNYVEAEIVWLEACYIAKEIGHAEALQQLDKLAKDLGHEGLAYWEAKAGL